MRDSKQNLWMLVAAGAAGSAAFVLLGLIGPRLINLHDNLALIAAVACYAAGLGLAGWCVVKLIRR